MGRVLGPFEDHPQHLCGPPRPAGVTRRRRPKCIGRVPSCFTIGSRFVVVWRVLLLTLARRAAIASAARNSCLQLICSWASRLFEE
eukprot:6122704-Prymnesium_polylepis.1